MHLATLTSPNNKETDGRSGVPNGKPRLIMLHFFIENDLKMNIAVLYNNSFFIIACKTIVYSSVWYTELPYFLHRAPFFSSLGFIHIYVSCVFWHLYFICTFVFLYNIASLSSFILTTYPTLFSCFSFLQSHFFIFYFLNPGLY